MQTAFIAALPCVQFLNTSIVQRVFLRYKHKKATIDSK